jgi:hypothetical protein
VLASLLAGVLALVAFVVVEARSKSPMMPLSMFKSRTFSGANILTFFLYAALSAVLFFVQFDLQQVQGLTPTEAGAASLPFIILVSVLSRWSGGLVSRYGPRLPLVVGPALAGMGFALFALPGVGADYWTGFFPPMAVLGLGMAVTVAPLTTTVMGAADESKSGVASGINNAVSRVAGLVAIAVFGIMMLSTYNASLDSRLPSLQLSPATRASIDSQRIRLAGTEIPPEVTDPQRSLLQSSIDDAFVAAFRLVALTCAGLALASAASAWLLVENKEVNSAPAASPTTAQEQQPMEEATCEHLDQIRNVQPNTRGCEECLKTGDTWVHLRLCMTCGHVGCCDNSKNKHATGHFHGTGHPIIRSLEPGEEWGWCYIDNIGFESLEVNEGRR